MTDFIKFKYLSAQNCKELSNSDEYHLDENNNEKKQEIWSKNLKRGSSKGEMASETVVKMRDEEEA